MIQTDAQIPHLADNLCLQVAKRKRLLWHSNHLFGLLAGEEIYDGRYKDEELYWAIQNYLAGDNTDPDVALNMPNIKGIEEEGRSTGQYLLECTDSFPRPDSFYQATCILLSMACGVEVALILANHWYDSMISHIPESKGIHDETKQIS